MTDSLSSTDHDPEVATSEAESEPVEAVEAVEVKGLDRAPRGFFARPAVAWTVAVVALVAAGFFGTQWADLYSAERTRTAVRAAGQDLALRLTTFEGENIEEWFASASQQATGEYAQQLTDVFNQASRDALREIEVVSRGEVENLFVQDVDGDEASVFAVVKQTYVNNTTPDPVEDELRLDITLELEDGEWLASEVAVLGPAGVVAPTGDAQPTPAPGEE